MSTDTIKHLIIKKSQWKIFPPKVHRFHPVHPRTNKPSISDRQPDYADGGKAISHSCSQAKAPPPPNLTSRMFMCSAKGHSLLRTHRFVRRSTMSTIMHFNAWKHRKLLSNVWLKYTVLNEAAEVYSVKTMGEKNIAFGLHIPRLASCYMYVTCALS
jgi:hypothetical protein